jgi:hypothetical protein
MCRADEALRRVSEMSQARPLARRRGSKIGVDLLISGAPCWFLVAA